MDDPDKPVDDALGALYRGLPQEAPPPALDAAILDAAKRSVAVRPSRRWAVPVSLAAVLVLSVAVTLRVADERPGVESAPVPSSVPEAPSPAQAKQAEVALAPKAAVPVAGPLPERRDARPPKPEPALAARPAAQPVPAFAPEPAPAPSAETAAAPAAAPRSDAPAAGLAMEGRAKRSMEARDFATAAALSPEAWLESIARLRAQGRHSEADESYAGFRKRYPDFAIPPEMRQRIAPPR